MKASGCPEFEPQSRSSQDGLFYSSPLETLVRRTSSRRQAATRKPQHTHPGQSGIAISPALRSCHAFAFAGSPPRPLTNPHVPDSPLLHSNFRGSTASAVTNTATLRASQNSKSFLSFTDDYELGDDGRAENYYDGQPPQPLWGSHNYPTFVIPSPTPHFESQTDLWQQACTGLPQPAATDLEDPMHSQPSPLPTVVISSPRDDDPRPSGPKRQLIVSQSGFARLNFSRPGRPPIISSEEQKQHVLERNAQRANSPRTSPSPVSFSPVTPLTGIYSEQLQAASDHLTSNEFSTVSSYLRPDGFYPYPSHHPPDHVSLPCHPPSLRAGSPSSLYSNSYSFYQLDSAVPSPRSLSPQSSPDVTPATSRPPSAEPQTPEEYLQLGIQYHEGDQLKDSAFYFEKSAKEQGGCGAGMLMWGLTLRHGWGCEKNEKGGFKWLRKAAELAVDDLEKAKNGMVSDVKGVKEELVLAIYEVGQCFFQGWGVPKDQKMAVNYYRVAAKLGDADAQQDLAFCLTNGKGCKKDKKEAARWYRAAVAQGASDVGMAWIYKDKYKD